MQMLKGVASEYAFILTLNVRAKSRTAINRYKAAQRGFWISTDVEQFCPDTH